MYIHATGSITCYPGTNGHTPHITVHLQLHGSGPYGFFNPGRRNVCGGFTCSVEDERYFNLQCGQRGAYTHYSLLTGTWTDGVTTYSVEVESVPNKGSYWASLPMTDDSPRSHAYWSGYRAVEKADEHRWRFQHPDRRGRPLIVEITFPDGYDVRRRLRTVAAIEQAIDGLRNDDDPPT